MNIGIFVFSSISQYKNRYTQYEGTPREPEGAIGAMLMDKKDHEVQNVIIQRIRTKTSKW